VARLNKIVVELPATERLLTLLALTHNLASLHGLAWHIFQARQAPSKHLALSPYDRQNRRKLSYWVVSVSLVSAVFSHPISCTGSAPVSDAEGQCFVTIKWVLWIQRSLSQRKLLVRLEGFITLFIYI
jgi:hypothetical protein